MKKYVYKYKMVNINGKSYTEIHFYKNTIEHSKDIQPHSEWVEHSCSVIYSYDQDYVAVKQTELSVSDSQYWLIRS